MAPESVRDLFVRRYGQEPQLIAVAPGRINLIGEHTDYNDGFVFPAAIDRTTVIALTAGGSRSELYSEQAREGHAFDVESVEPKTVEGWAKFPAGMAWAFRRDGKSVVNVHGVVSSDIPMASGVSSSAALEMAFGVAWSQLCDLGYSNPEIAQLGKVCENQFVGVNSGIMDQMASAMGKAGSAMFLDTRSLEITYAPVPSDLAVVLCDTKKPRALTDSAYNERRSQCEEAAEALGVKKLRDATMPALEAAKAKLSDIVFRRARHVITEDDRCVEFRHALDVADRKRVGELMKASHVSLRDDYEVSCPELDAMAESAWAAPGCVGARMTGAGFGGACVALVERASLEAFISETLSGYTARSKRDGEAMACGIVDGARVLRF